MSRAPVAVANKGSCAVRGAECGEGGAARAGRGERGAEGEGEEEAGAEGGQVEHLPFKWLQVSPAPDHGRARGAGRGEGAHALGNDEADGEEEVGGLRGYSVDCIISQLGGLRGYSGVKGERVKRARVGRGKEGGSPARTAPPAAPAPAAAPRPAAARWRAPGRTPPPPPEGAAPRPCRGSARPARPAPVEPLVPTAAQSVAIGRRSGGDRAGRRLRGLDEGHGGVGVVGEERGRERQKLRPRGRVKSLAADRAAGRRGWVFGRSTLRLMAIKWLQVSSRTFQASGPRTKRAGFSTRRKLGRHADSEYTCREGDELLGGLGFRVSRRGRGARLALRARGGGGARTPGRTVPAESHAEMLGSPFVLNTGWQLRTKSRTSPTEENAAAGPQRGRPARRWAAQARGARAAARRGWGRPQAVLAHPPPQNEACRAGGLSGGPSPSVAPHARGARVSQPPLVR